MTRTTLLRLLIACLGGAAVLLGAWALVAVPDPRGRPFYVVALLASSWSLGFGTLAVLIAWKGGAERGILLAGLFLAIMALKWSLGTLGVLPGPAWDPLFFAFGALGYGAGVRFTQAFPVSLDRGLLDSLWPGPQSRVLLILPKLLLDGRVFWLWVIGLEVVQHGLFPDASIVWHALIYAGLASFYLWAGLKAGSDDDRRKTYWILEGVLVFLALEALWAGVFVTQRFVDLPFAMGSFSDWLMVVEGWAALICFAIAIFFHGAFDSALVLRRTAVVSIASGIGLVLFVTVEEAVAGSVASVTGWDTGAGSIVGGVVAALALKPISNRLDRLMRGREVSSKAVAGSPPDEVDLSR